MGQDAWGTVSAPQPNTAGAPCENCGTVAKTIVVLSKPSTDNQTGESYTTGVPCCSKACASAWWAGFSKPDLMPWQDW
jgi:hypothetical protein